MREYKDFEITIQPKDSDGRYPLFAKGPTGEASGSMTLSASDYAEHLKIEEMGPRAGQTAALQAVGRMLFARLFPDSIQRLYERSRDIEELRVRLIINPPELGWLHWEYLYDERKKTFPAISTRTVLVRHIPLPEMITPVAVHGPLRILAMIAAPKNLPTLNVAREKDFMQKELAELVQKGRVELDIAEGTQRTRCTQNGVENLPYSRRIATRPGLIDLLREGYHAFHFIGHGMFNQDSQTGELALEDEDTGEKSELTADVLRALFCDASIKLAVLNGCETGMTSAKEPLLGAAPALVEAGIPAVVAMQFAIPDQTAITFSRTFYGALADGFPVDAAVAESRKAIYARAPDRRDWGIPVLFMRSPDGVLWDIKSNPAGQHAPVTQQSQEPVQENVAMKISPELHQKLLDFFTSFPNIQTPGTPQALVGTAKFDLPLMNQINFNVPPLMFFPLLLSLLEGYGRLQDGRHPIVALLQAAKTFLAGQDGRSRCDSLIRELGGIPAGRQESQMPSTQPNNAPHTGGTTMHITIGNGAKVEGFTIGNGNQLATNVKTKGNFVQNSGGTVSISETTAAAPAVTSAEEMLAVLQEISKLTAGLEGGSKKAKSTVEHEVEQAILEIEEPEGGKEPEKQTIISHLQKAAETLKAAGATTVQAAAFGKLIGQAITWLGPQADGLLKLLGM